MRFFGNEAVRRFRGEGRPRLERLEDRLLLTSPPYVVTSTADSGSGSLRAAITQADAAGVPATINFQIGSGGLQTISLLSALPAITVPITIDGTSQPGSNGTPAIALDGTGAPAGANGLVVAGGASTIKGLIVENFKGSGILIEGAGGDLVQSCYLGVDPTGLTAAGNGGQGIIIRGAGKNTIGGLTTGSGNLISGNKAHGIAITDGSTDDLIEGNYIGVDQTGLHALGNAFDGIVVINGRATIGGTASGARNIISANGNDGIALNQADGSIVRGNYLGTDRSGLTPLGNAANGITAIGSVSLVIGGSASSARNLLSGNTGDGLFLSGANDLVQGNFIGVDASGGRSLGNGGDGILLSHTNNVTIGGTASGAGNVVSANLRNGLSDVPANPPASFFPNLNLNDVIQGNFIGTDATGAKSLGNKLDGISLVSGVSNLIGGPGGGNLISANGGDGIYLGRDGNVVQANTVGTNFFGDHAMPNAGNGVIVVGNDNLIGGLSSGTGNLISGNGQNGIVIGGDPASASVGNQIFGNIVGADRSTSFAVANGRNGVLVGPNASSVVIGQNLAGSANLIGGNHDSGIILADASRVYIIGNSIGSAAGFVPTGGAPIPNGSDGVTVFDSSHVLIGGLYDGMPNTIADNATKGVSIVGNSSDVAVLSNIIRDNGQLGIDIGNNGVSPNTNQNPANRPVLVSALNPVLGGNTVVVGTINSAPNSSVLIQFFANSAADPSGSGQGQTPVGSVEVQTDSNGNASFKAALSRLLTVGQVVSATATTGIGASVAGSSMPAFGTTSEFSNDTTVAAGPQPADLSLSLTQSTNFPSINGVVTYTLVVTNQGPGSATNVVLTDHFPASSIAVGATVSQGTASLSTNTLTFNLGTIAPGSSATTTVMVVPRQAGSFTDSATVLSDSPDPNLDNNSAAVAYSSAPSPRVQSVTVQAFRGDVTSVVVRFSAPMDQSRAGNPANYAFYLPNAQGAFAIPVVPAVAAYQAGSNSVILTPSRLIPAGGFFMVSFNGLTSTGLTDAAGRPLDGLGIGAPSGNYTAIVGIGQNLAYNDARNNLVRLHLTGDGLIDLTRSLNGDALSLQVVGATFGVLNGEVIPGAGGSGVTPLPQVLIPPGVFAQLPSPPFLIGGVSIQSIGTIRAAAFDALAARGPLPSFGKNLRNRS